LVGYLVDGVWVKRRPIRPLGHCLDHFCSDLLRTAKPDEDGTAWFNPMPPGCPTIDDKVNTRSVDVVNAGAVAASE
jgi:hypothetical protein